MIRRRIELGHAGLVILITCGTALVVLGFRPTRALAQEPITTRRVSVAGDGAQVGGESTYPVISADGRYVAFSSDASNLVPGDHNQAGDVFLEDCSSGTIVCVSVALSGGPSGDESYSPSISADGQRVAFVSQGADLLTGDGNRVADVFVRDLALQTTTRASVSSSGVEADGPSSAPRLSADGRYVAFVSFASNLVLADTNGCSDIFVRDLQTNAVERVSVGSGGEQADGTSEGASISADGRFVVFASMAQNLVTGGGGSADPKCWQIYRHDRMDGTVVRLSVTPSGLRGDGSSFTPSISADGRYVAFASNATNLISSDLNAKADIYVRDVQAGSTVRVGTGSGGQEPAGESLRPSVSGDGRFVVFESTAANLVPEFAPPGSTWIYMSDLVTGATTRVVAASPEVAADGGAVSPAMSSDGRWVAFSSAESTLITGDSNGVEDVFIRGPLH